MSIGNALSSAISTQLEKFVSAGTTTEKSEAIRWSAKTPPLVAKYCIEKEHGMRQGLRLKYSAVPAKKHSPRLQQQPRIKIFHQLLPVDLRGPWLARIEFRSHCVQRPGETVRQGHEGTLVPHVATRRQQPHSRGAMRMHEPSPLASRRSSPRGHGPSYPTRAQLYPEMRVRQHATGPSDGSKQIRQSWCDEQNNTLKEFRILPRTTTPASSVGSAAHALQRPSSRYKQCRSAPRGRARLSQSR